MKSECCGAEIINYNDGLGICSECKEHCGAECSEKEECSLLLNSTNPVNRKPLNQDNSLDMLIDTLENILALNQLQEICSLLDLLECCKLWNYPNYDNTGDTDCQTCPFYSYSSLQEVIEKLRGMR